MDKIVACSFLIYRLSEESSLSKNRKSHDSSSVSMLVPFTDQRVLVEVRQSRKSSSTPEPGAADDDGGRGRLWDKQL